MPQTQNSGQAQAHLHLLRRSLEIPVPLMISIVLSRISNRKDIPKVVIDLRDEFSAARSELWTMFEEADFRLFDTARSAKILLEIEKAAAEIVPRAMSAHDFSFPLRFDLIGRLLEFDGLGLIKDARDFASSAIWRKFSRIDAAYLVQMNLESVELRGLLSRHLTEHEIHSIAANR